MPRRALLAGAGAVAAGVIGAAADRAFTSSPSPTPATGGQLQPTGGVWVAVAQAADVTEGVARRFATPAVVGFVTRHQGALTAVSGVCTHQGCLLTLNQPAGRLDCPCHRTSFGFDGKLLSNQLPTPPAALPQLLVRARAGHVEAFVPNV